MALFRLTPGRIFASLFLAGASLAGACHHRGTSAPLPPVGEERLGFEELRHMLPPDGFPTRAILLGELDGDGDLDAVLLAFEEASDRLYLNDGNGVFDDASGGLPAGTDWSQAGAMGDVDGDGDLDLVVALTDGSIQPGKRNRLLLNDGDASFTDATIRMLVAGGHTSCLALAD